MLADGVDVRASGRVTGSVVVLGDSITDTVNTTGNAAQADAFDGERGLGGNRVLAARVGEPYFGTPALERLDRDVLAQSGVRVVILLDQQIVRRMHAVRLPIIGGTVMSFKGSFVWTTERERTWNAVNNWIRTSGVFDGVIGFAAATAVVGDPATLNPAYNSGDHLHPKDADVQAMADAVDLSLLRTRISTH